MILNEFALNKENSLGQKIVNPENFWKWFGDSITKDEQGRPLVFYHGTRSDFKEFKTSYGDKLVFFAFQKEFADKWGRKKSYDNNMSIEVEDILYTYKNKLFAEYKKKYGDNFYIDNDAAREKLLKEIDNKKFELEKERNVHNRTLGCYLKVHKIFHPEKDYELVLDEICKYYQWKNPYTKEYEEQLKEFENKYETAQKYWNKWRAENKDADEKTIKTETDKLDYAFKNFSVWRSIKNEFDNNMKRIKQGAWIYFEHENVINKIWELGYDAIQLSESNGEQTTLAVRVGNNQIKSTQNNGNYNSSENIYEDFGTKTGMTSYDMALSDSKYAQRKSWFGQKIKMSPTAYIEECALMFSVNKKLNGSEDEPTTYQSLYNERLQDRKLIDELKEKIQKGEMDVPVLHYEVISDGKTYFTQEGLHRAIAAKELGYKMIPVYVFVSKAYKAQNVDEQLLKKILGNKIMLLNNKKSYLHEKDGRLEKLNNDIENYLAEINKKHGTQYAPTGIVRMKKYENINEEVNVLNKEKSSSEFIPVLNENFKRWFADSKVVDENGQPLVCYHGSTVDIEEFDLGYSGSTTGNNVEKVFYFTSDKDTAITYSQEATVRENEWRFYDEETGFEDWDDYAEHLRNEVFENPKINPCYLYMKNPYIYDANYSKFDYKKNYTLCSILKGNSDIDYEYWDEDFALELRDEFYEYIENEDGEEEVVPIDTQYDGLIIKNVIDNISPDNQDYIDEYIVWDPYQIKSVYNKGIWSNASANVFESVNEKFEELNDSIYATKSSYDIINWMKNKPKHYRIIYDKNIRYYFICDGLNYIHQDMLEEAYYAAFYPDWLSASDCRDYIDKEVGSNLLFFAFAPKGKNIDKEKSSDGYSRKYTYDFGTIYAHELTPLEDFDIYKDLGEPIKKEDIFENYKYLNKKIEKFLEDYYTPWLLDNDDIRAFEIFQEFFSDQQDGIKHYQWELIPAEQYHNALKMYMRDGANFKFPQRTLENWLNIICKNVTVLDVFTDIAGHSQYFPLDDFNDCFMGENPTDDNDVAWKTLEEEGFWDWAVLPDGSDAISDYGRKPIMDILTELDQFATPEEMIIAINRCLDVAHCRGDLASAFIEGGSKSCWEISNT